MRSLALLGTLLACAVLPAVAYADVPGPIVDRIDPILNAGGGTTGLYVKEVGGPVIAARNELFAFEPASSTKVLLHLYAHTQLQAGNVMPTTQVTLYAGASGTCPNGAAVNGTEDLIASTAKMMRVSDNPATRAQWELWTADPGWPGFLTSLALGQTTFPNYIGCQVAGSQTVDDNTTSLTDLGIMYEVVADSSVLQDPWRASFYDTMSGREQFEDFGFDFTGIWPKLVTMSNQEKPAGFPNALLQDFRAGMTANHKGGSYGRCTDGDDDCDPIIEYLSFAGSAVFPTCESGSFTSRSYVWGIFIHGAQNPAPPANGSTPAGTALGNAAAEPLREQLNAALAGWGACYPPDVTVTTIPAAAPAGQDGFYNAGDLAANGGGIRVDVSATDDSGVTNLVCTDNGTPVAVGNQVGSNPRTGWFLVSSDGSHAIECEATDGMTPANTGASVDSDNEATFKIDATPPSLACLPAVFVLNGPGGNVTATVSDGLSGPATPTASSPADVSSAGAKFAAVTGEDNAGNSTTVQCAYIVSYVVLGFFQPLHKDEAQAGSTIPVKFALADANGVRISDAEAQAIADACDARIFFTAGDPSPNCADYHAGADAFHFNLKTPNDGVGPQTITLRVFDGVIVINEHAYDVLMR